MSKRVIDITYRDFESIPMWKDIVAKAITEYFTELEGEGSRIVSMKISLVNQLPGKKFRVEFSAEKTFDKDLLSARVIKALRDEEVDMLLQKEINRVTEHLIISLRDNKIKELVVQEHDDIRVSLEALITTKFKQEQNSMASKVAALENEMLSKFKSHNERLENDKAIFDSVVEDTNQKLEGYDKLKKESLDVVQNHKNFDGLAFGVSLASMLTSLMIVLFLLLS